MPPAQSTAASGMFPTEQTNESAATIGPTMTFSSSCSAPPLIGDEQGVEEALGSSATKPAITKPARISFQSISTSPRKLCATADHASSEKSFGPDSRDGCAWPASPPTACSRACSSSRRETKRRTPSHMSAMSTKPPTNSASVNSQPRKIHMTIPSSNTRFVEANWKTIADAKLAPFWNSDFAIAIAA